jgi:hypothetical protein
VIPVTGRTDDALARVMIEVRVLADHPSRRRDPPARRPVAGRGGMTKSGPCWWRRNRRFGISPPHGRGRGTGGYRVSRHSVEEWLTYLSVKSDDDGTALLRLRARLEERAAAGTGACTTTATISLDGERGVQKHDAVRRVAAELEREGPIVTIGAGDSLTDIPFCAPAISPWCPGTARFRLETWSAYSP